MLRKLGKRAQTTAEYAILIALVVGAVVAMQVYVRRGLQGRIKNVVDHTGTGGELSEEGNAGSISFTAEQYEPYYLESTAKSNQTANDKETLGAGGTVARTSNTESDATRNQKLGWNGAPTP